MRSVASSSFSSEQFLSVLVALFQWKIAFPLEKGWFSRQSRTVMKEHETRMYILALQSYRCFFTNKALPLLKQEHYNPAHTAG